MMPSLNEVSANDTSPVMLKEGNLSGRLTNFIGDDCFMGEEGEFGTSSPSKTTTGNNNV